MPSRREAIAMTAAEVAAYLREQPRIILVTNGPDGLPHPVPMNFGLDDQGRVLMTSFRKAQKVLNIERDPRAVLLVESGDGYDSLKSVMLYCNVELIDGAEEVARAMAAIGAKGGFRANFSQGQNDQVKASLAKRIVMRFTPFRTVSWDHTKLGGAY